MIRVLENGLTLCLRKEACEALDIRRASDVLELDQVDKILDFTRQQAVRRERIATAALQGLLASDAKPQAFDKQFPFYEEPQTAATLAVELADALIAVLDKESEATK
jgi:hypothetical protein